MVVGALTFIAACILQVGVNKSIEAWGGQEVFTQYVKQNGQKDSNIPAGITAGWYTACGWIVFLILDIFGYFKLEEGPATTVPVSSKPPTLSVVIPMSGAK